MPTEPTFDLEAVVAPISGDRPTGEYLRHADIDRFQQARDLRAAAVAAEGKQRELAMLTEDDLADLPEEDRRVESPDWRSVRNACLEILKGQSKDLWIAAWLIEANTRLSGFAGLRDAFRVVTELVDNYWGTLYPPPDEEEGYVDCVSQLAALNGTDRTGILIVPLQEISLVPGEPEMSYAAHRHALKGTGQFTEAEFAAAIRRADPDSLRDVEDDLAEAVEAFEAMIEILEAKCGEHNGMPVAPPSSQIRQTLEEIQRTFRQLTRDVLAGGGGEIADATGEPDTPTESGNRTIAASGVDLAQAQVNSREDAFRMLLKAAEFFRKTEPHSPVSYMLQQAVRFGRMDLPDLLRELINDEDVLQRFAERTGVELRSSEDYDE